MSFALVLQSARLRLRVLTPADAGGPYLQWMNDSEVTKYLESRFHRFTEKDLKEYITLLNKRANVLFMGIFLGDSDVHIGNIKLEMVEHHHRGEIGILVGDKAQWGKGFASEAIQRLSDHALRTLKLHKVTAGCYSNNVASQRAFEKAGFIIEGRRREHFRFADQWVDLILLARVAQSTGS